MVGKAGIWEFGRLNISSKILLNLFSILQLFVKLQQLLFFTYSIVVSCVSILRSGERAVVSVAGIPSENFVACNRIRA